MSRIIERLTKSIRDAAVYNSDVQMAPQCIIWTDKELQWNAVIPRLLTELPELFVLGDYNPEKRSGPAIWLRLLIAGKVQGLALPKDRPAILYLPDVSRQDLRAVETCPELLKPLAELQYRGVIWSHNSKDWSILVFLKSKQGGLGLDVAQDNETNNGMQLALHRFLDEDLDLLQESGRHLDKDYFNSLLTSGDSIKDLLQWLDQGDAFKTQYNKNEWQAFVALCKSQFGFNPDNEGVLSGVERLANHEGAWQSVWDRYCEAPKRYPNIPRQIKKCQAPNNTLLWSLSDGKFSGWPQWNEEQESSLLKDLLCVSMLPPHEARARVIDLEKRHSARRSLVWAELGEAPLALALQHLSIIAEVTSNSLSAGTAEDLYAAYCITGWTADDAVLRSLACIEKQEDINAVFTAIRATYLPWAEDCARHLQLVVDQGQYPGGSISNCISLNHKDGDCVYFIDGLRFDTAKRLAAKLNNNGLNVNERPVWAALPSVTPTGKPAVSPVRDKIKGLETNVDFEPMVAERDQSLKGGYQLKKLLEENGWTILDASSYGTGQGNAWCEFGDIDSEGHERGWKLAKRIDSLIDEIAEKVIQLVKLGGWKSVRIVTDHGWLLVPGGLPKVDLPSALSDNKWGRCAVIKPGAKTEERLYPWFWNSNQYFALADGIGCFRKNIEYAHGGLSLQECVNLELTVTSAASLVEASQFDISFKWKGLRCTVALEGDCAELRLDVRTQPGNDETSVVVSTKSFREDGTASVMVEDEVIDGHEAYIVILDEAGELVAQKLTRIGRNQKDGGTE